MASRFVATHSGSQSACFVVDSETEPLLRYAHKCKRAIKSGNEDLDGQVLVNTGVERGDCTDVQVDSEPGGQAILEQNKCTVHKDMDPAVNEEVAEEAVQDEVERSTVRRNASIVVEGMTHR